MVAKLLNNFMHWKQCLGILIYNEFSLQFELGCYLRANGYIVRFERNISAYTSANTSNFTKREIDIVLFQGEDETKAEKIAIELKFPRNGQVPEQMFSFINDIKFMEEVGNNIKGFSETFVLCIVDDSNFYESQRKQEGIYNYFRPRINIPANTIICKPTGIRNRQLYLQNNYETDWVQPTADWLDQSKYVNNYRYYILKCK